MMILRTVSIRSGAALLFLAALFIVGVPGTGAAATGLSQSDLEALFPGRFQARYQGNNVTLHAEPSGQLLGYSPVGADSGSWSVEGGQLCVMLADWLDGRTMCSSVIEADGWYRASSVFFRKM